ncbi:MAG: hypothetical protein ACTSR8_19860 [Promethearchaeota archaeon]
MFLNWIPEVIVDLIDGIPFLVGGIMCFKKEPLNKNRTIFYLRLVWFSISAFFICEAISYLLLDNFLGRFYAILLIPAIVFLLIAINYNYKEKFYSKNLILLSGLLIYFMVQPNSSKIGLEDGKYRIIWYGMFGLIGNLYIYIFAAYYFIWVFITWKNAPFEIKEIVNIYFEKKFGGILKNKDNTKEIFKDTYSLIEKFFNIFPIRLIDHKNQHFLISKNYYYLPPKLQEKVNENFSEKEDIDFFKCEIQRTSEELFSEYLKLRDDLKKCY